MPAELPTAPEKANGGDGQAAAKLPKDFAGLVVKLVEQSEDGREIGGATVTATAGETVYKAEAEAMPVITTQIRDGKATPVTVFKLTGRYLIALDHPAPYELKIKLLDGQHSTQTVVFRKEVQEMAVVCPRAAPESAGADHGPTVAGRFAGSRVTTRIWIDD